MTTTCQSCNAPLAQPERGRKKRFCDATCRQRWCRWRRRTRTKHLGYVYLISTSSEHKIGAARDVKRRMKKLNPGPYRVLHTIYTEHMFLLEGILHDAFADKRVDGEWFKLDKADINWMKSLGNVLLDGLLPAEALTRKSERGVQA